MPIILATQEAEIRRIEVRSQRRAHNLRDPISKNPLQKEGWWSDSRCRPWAQASALQKQKQNLEKNGYVD
jgi:hypothetical protein